MVWSPVTGLPIQYSEDASGTAASGNYLKFYASGTTTPINMATDSTGGTTLAKCQLNSLGHAINGSSAVFVPHIDQKYKAVLYPDSTTADANTFASAIWNVDGITPPGVDALVSVRASGEFVKEFDTMAAAIASTTLVVGDVLLIKDRANSHWDVVLSSGVTENTYNVVQCTGVGTLSLNLRVNGVIHFNAWGGATTATATQNTDVMAAAITYANAFSYDEPIIVVDGGLYDINYIDLTNTANLTFFANGTVTFTGKSSATKNFLLGSTNYNVGTPSASTKSARIKFIGGIWLMGVDAAAAYTYVGRFEHFVECEFNHVYFSGECGPSSGADRICAYYQYSYINKFKQCSFAVPAVPGASYYSYAIKTGNDNNNLNEWDTCRAVGILGNPTAARTVLAGINGNSNRIVNGDFSGAYFGININGSRGGYYNLYMEGCTELVTTGPAGVAGAAYGNTFEGGYYEIIQDGIGFRLGINGGSQNTTIISPKVKGLAGATNRTFIDMVSSGATYGLSVISPDLENIDTYITGTYRGMSDGITSGITQSHWVSFPPTQIPSSDVNTLDDYEEGTWTPAQSGVTFSAATGYYTKIGNLVTLTFSVTWPVTADATGLAFSGVPFSAAGGRAGNNGLAVGTNSSATYVTGMVSGTGLYIYKLGGAAAVNSDFSGDTLSGTITYTV